MQLRLHVHHIIITSDTLGSSLSSERMRNYGPMPLTTCMQGVCLALTIDSIDYTLVLGAQKSHLKDPGDSIEAKN